MTATHLARELDLEPGYLSRILRRLQQRGLMARRRPRPGGAAPQLRAGSHRRDLGARPGAL